MLSTLKWVSAGQIKAFTLVLVYYKLKVPLKRTKKSKRTYTKYNTIP